MLTARDIMTREVITVRPNVNLKETVRMLVENKISGMPVCDEHNHLVGMISEKDILNFMFSGNLESTTVEEAMSKHIISFTPDTPIDKISLTIGEKQIRRVPILEKGKLVGVVSRRSIIRTVLDLPK